MGVKREAFFVLVDVCQVLGPVGKAPVMSVFAKRFASGYNPLGAAAVALLGWQNGAFCMRVHTSTQPPPVSGTT